MSGVCPSVPSRMPAALMLCRHVLRGGRRAARRPMFWWPRQKLADLDLPHTSVTGRTGRETNRQAAAGSRHRQTPQLFARRAHGVRCAPFGPGEGSRTCRRVQRAQVEPADLSAGQRHDPRLDVTPASRFARHTPVWGNTRGLAMPAPRCSGLKAARSISAAMKNAPACGAFCLKAGSVQGKFGSFLPVSSSGQSRI